MPAHMPNPYHLSESIDDAPVSVLEPLVAQQQVASAAPPEDPGDLEFPTKAWEKSVLDDIPGQVAVWSSPQDMREPIGNAANGDFAAPKAANTKKSRTSHDF